MKHKGQPRRTAIFPITIESPFGRVVLAYRVQDGKILGKPFRVHTCPAVTTSGAAELWAELSHGVQESLSALWWDSLPVSEQLDWNADWDTPGVLMLSETGKALLE